MTCFLGEDGGLAFGEVTPVASVNPEERADEELYDVEAEAVACVMSVSALCGFAAAAAAAAAGKGTFQAFVLASNLAR